MIHLPPLPGYPDYSGMDGVVKKALKDLKVLEKAGFNGVLVENTDTPGFVAAPSEIKKAMKKVTKEVIRKSSLPVGMEIVYDMTATINIAASLGCNFVRLDVFADTVKTRWGIVPYSYKEVNKILASYSKKPLLLVDVHVKHAKLLSKKSLEKSIKISLKHGANGIIITGKWTGIEPKLEDLKQARKVIGDKVPIIIGSGLNFTNTEKLLSLTDGAIVGTSIKTGDYIDFKKASDLAAIAKQSKNY